MAKGAVKKLFTWKGLMADSPTPIRRTAIGLLALICCAMVATQTSYFVVFDAHIIAVLAPITACGLLYGPLSAMLVGALTGLVEMGHALYLPLDAYEAYFAAPSNSILLFAFMGLLMGVLFALVDGFIAKRRSFGIVVLILFCLLGSAVFSILFSVLVNAINSLMHLEVPAQLISDITGNRELINQILADFGLMALLAIVGGEVVSRQGKTEEATLRETFQSWLAVVMIGAYLITASLAYTVVTAGFRASAEKQMQSQIDYLEGQLKERDSLLSGAQRRLKLTEGAIEELHLSSIGGVATGLPLGEGAVAAVAEDGTIASSSEESYVGQSFEDIVGSGLARGFDESLYQNSRSTQWYMGSQGLGYLRAAEVGYVRVSRTGKYQIMAAMSSNAMFALRPWIMGGLSALFAALFALVYAQASILLREVVVHNIDETNETLALITQGDLSKSVNVNSPAEFARLASGINATVGSLKDAIAAEAARIDRDLATARAIQEGALPRTFPPFPEIQAFDVYASMDAAREVGGDFYDMFLVGEHTVFLLIADVSGKGIPASLFMMAAKTQISNAVSAGMELSEAIKTANWHLCQGNEAGMFVTVWAALFDYETGELTYVNAGHNFPLLRHNGTWQWLREKGGLFLGAFDSAKFRSSSITLEPGDELLLYTDGVNEAFSAADEQYGDDRLEAFLNNHAELHPRALSDALRADLARWAKGAEQSDDITMLALEYGVPPQATGSLTVPAKMEHLDDVLNLVHGELAQRNCPISVQSQLDIVVEELFVNICSYAYEDAEKVGDCRIDYVYNTNPSSLSLAITDWGVPFDPLEHQDPDKPHSAEDAAIGGLGIMMVKRMCDDVSYHRDGDANVVLLRKDW